MLVQRLTRMAMHIGMYTVLYMAICLALLVACQSEAATEQTPPADGAAAIESTEPTSTTATITTIAATIAVHEELVAVPPTAASLVQGVVITAVPPTVQPTVAPTATLPPFGSAERPIQLLFPPVTDGSVISARGEVLAEALAEATELAFEVGVVDSETSLLQLLCSAPADTIGIVSAAGYVLAEEQCAAQVGPVAQRSDDQQIWQLGMIVTRRGSGLNDLEDLDGRSWAVANTGDLSTFHFFEAELAAAGIEPGEITFFPEDSSALLSVLNGESDFATADYVPPILPGGERWVYGEDAAEPWRITGLSPQRSPIGYVLVNGEPANGGYRLRDARARLFDTTPTIYDQTQIIGLSQPIPNQTVVFGADIPQSVVGEVSRFLVDFGASEACATSLCASDLYNLAGLQLVEDGAYEPVRFMIEQLALTAADLGLTGEQ